MSKLEVATTTSTITAIQYSPTNVELVDVLVIGAGPVGLSIALWFAKQSYSVLVVEKYSESRSPSDAFHAFNDRKQQVGINPKSIKFMRKLDVAVWGNMKAQGCYQQNWINIPIGKLQTILYEQIKKYSNVKFLFNSQLESVNAFDPQHNARVSIVQSPINSLGESDKIYAVYPELIIVSDGRQDDRGSAKQFFNFPNVSKVHFSTYGIIGILKREQDCGSICLKSHTSDDYFSELYPELGVMHVRLLGSMQERYIALGTKINVTKFKQLDAEKIYNLLEEAYNKMRDIAIGEPELESFTEFSKTPIPIILDYRKETIKVLEGSTTIVSVEGDASRKTTFFSGSGLNSALEGVSTLFKFCEENSDLVFSSIGDAAHLLSLDQKLLEKDAASMKVSLSLLMKGSSFITGTKLIASESQDLLGTSSDDSEEEIELNKSSSIKESGTKELGIPSKESSTKESSTTNGFVKPIQGFDKLVHGSDKLVHGSNKLARGLSRKDVNRRETITRELRTEKSMAQLSHSPLDNEGDIQKVLIKPDEILTARLSRLNSILPSSGVIPNTTMSNNAMLRMSMRNVSIANVPMSNMSMANMSMANIRRRESDPNSAIPSDSLLDDTIPQILDLVPKKGPIGSHLYIIGTNLIGKEIKCPTVKFIRSKTEYINDAGTIIELDEKGTEKGTPRSDTSISGTPRSDIDILDVVAYDNGNIGFKIPENTNGVYSITLIRSDLKTTISPMTFEVVKVTEAPKITEIKDEQDYISIYGDNFVMPISVTITPTTNNVHLDDKVHQDDEVHPNKDDGVTFEGYSKSLHSLKISPYNILGKKIEGKYVFVVTTANGNSLPYEKNFSNF